MTQKILTLFRWLTPAYIAMVLLPAAAEAGHRLDCGRLMPAVDRVHSSAIHFEQLACQRWFPRHEVDYIRLMTKKACRLADGTRRHAPYGRIRADYNVLRAFVRTVDHRLNRHCAKQYDHRLMRCWNLLKDELRGVGCLIEGCADSCCHMGRRHRVSHIVAPAHDAYGSPYDRLSRRHVASPSAALNYDGISRGHHFGIADSRLEIRPMRGRLPDEHHRPRRSASVGAPWLDLLAATLSR
jgi:hypothetical protein